ncbi:hypothetical protein QFC19_003986 [Naganishia cerealis]|uniref:Uncharacterized protein n=1 Tax=Naganishia cerealis TaxID=610337 RepID=A0ACC2VZ50_9TREE|nr:hypothetical protein QFC19_003986 [Naganishia cerealis]
MAPVPSSLKEMTPAPTSALVAGLGLTTSHSNNTGKTPSSSTINTYNPRKDVSGSTSAALSAMSPKFWGATSGSAGGGYTTCHTTFVPDLVFPGASGAMSPPSLSSSSYTSAYSSPAASTTSSASPYLFARANLNPLLNDPANKSSTAMEPTSPVTSSISLSTPTDGSDLSDSFGNWSAQNGFTWNNLDAYRMQLWSRMARDASYARQGVPVEMRPKFLREQHPKSPPSSSLSIGLNEALSPVGTTYPAAPPTYRESHDDPVPSITQIIQHTISTRLFSSFLNALKAPPATAGNGTGGRLDPEKIADIASGKARLGVLPSEPPAYSEKHRAAADAFDVEAEQALAMSFTNLKLATESIARSKSAALTTGPR